MEDFLSLQGDPALVLERATAVYEEHIAAMRAIVAELQSFRSRHTLTPARKVWQLGDQIIELMVKIESMSLEIEGLYDHLVRDLGVKRKWLEKVLTLRRYIPHEEYIPLSMNWGRLEKGTGRKARLLRDAAEGQVRTQ